MTFAFVALSKDKLIGFAFGLLAFVPVVAFGFAYTSARPVVFGIWLFLGTAAFIYVSCLDPVVKHVDQVLTIAPLPVLGCIDKSASESEVDEVLPGMHRIREKLGGWLSVSGRQLFITSGDAEDGKSLLASGLALSLAQSGLQVTLVDVNFGNPNQANIFGISETPGLAEHLLAPEMTDSRSIGHRVKRNLRVITAGNGQVSLECSTFLNLKTELRAASDVVIYDCGAATENSDALALLDRDDYLVVVVRLQHTCARSLRLLTNRIGRQEMADAGLIFFGADEIAMTRAS